MATYAQTLADYLAAERRLEACRSGANYRIFRAAADALEDASAERNRPRDQAHRQPERPAAER